MNHWVSVINHLLMISMVNFLSFRYSNNCTVTATSMEFILVISHFWCNNCTVTATVTATTASTKFLVKLRCNNCRDHWYNNCYCQRLRSAEAKTVSCWRTRACSSMRRERVVTGIQWCFNCPALGMNRRGWSWWIVVNWYLWLINYSQ